MNPWKKLQTYEYMKGRKNVDLYAGEFVCGLLMFRIYILSKIHKNSLFEASHYKTVYTTCEQHTLGYSCTVESVFVSLLYLFAFLIRIIP